MTAVATASGQTSRAALVGHVSLADPKYDASTEYGDNSDGIAAAIDDTPEGGTIFVPDGSWTYQTPPSITKPITFVGESQFATILIANGCNGIEVAAGVTSFCLRNLELASAVRHTTTPNTLIGVLLNGSTGSRPANHVYEDVFIDGFRTGMDSSWLWSSAFRNFRTAHAQTGLYVKGLSVNNMFDAGQISGDASEGSRGIVIGDGTTPTEGWIISNTLTYNNQIGIEGVGATHCKVHDCILDYNTNSGVVVRAGTSNFGGNWDIHDNYIAISGAGGDAGITLGNTISNSQDRGCRVHDNEILAYAGSTCQRGIKATASQSRNHNIHDNTIWGMAAHDIDANYDMGITMHSNKGLSSVTHNFVGGSEVYGNSPGTTYYARSAQRFHLGKMSMTYDEAVPTQYTWAVGDICWKVNVVAGGSPGWVCTTAGTPGTWKALPNIAA